MTDWFSELAKTWNQDPLKVEQCMLFSERIRKNIKLDPSMRVLDFGCGTGLVGISLLKDVKTVGFIDPSSAMIEVLRESLVGHNINNFEIVEGEIFSFHGEPFDLIVSHMVLHHIEDLKTTIQALYNNLSPKGKIIIVDMREMHHHGPNPIPHHGFNSDKFKKIFEEVGFTNVIIEEYPPFIHKPKVGHEINANRFVLMGEK